MSRSRRYWRQRELNRKPASGKAKIMSGIYKEVHKERHRKNQEIRERQKTEEEQMAKKWKDFSIVPGMSTWVDMPDSYKNQYFKYQEKVKKKKESDRKEKRKLKQLTESAKSGKMTPVQLQQVKNMIRDSGVSVDSHFSNMMDDKFFRELNDGIDHKDGLKKILFICDVRGWAWWNKSHYLKHYLHNDFNIDIINVVGPGKSSVPVNGYDLWFTFGYSYIGSLKKIPKEKKVCGVTAHRRKSIIKPMMNKAANVHANSILLYDELKTMHNSVFYVPNGVDENLFRPIKAIDPEKPLIVGHIGKKCQQKGQEGIIFPAIAKSGVTSVTNTKDYRNRMPYCQMYKTYQDIDVFIVASDEDGTPNPALEAAACGRPIISNRIGNMPEFIKDGVNGFIVGKNIDSYVEKLKWCAENKDKLIEMGRQARLTVERHWTWKIQAENYRKMLKRILNV